MGNDELLLLFMPALCHREEDLERPLPRERLMQAVCRWRTSQGGPPQAADNGCIGDEISGGKMYPGPATSPPRRASQFSLAPLSTPAHRLTHLFQRGQKRKPFALISRLRKAHVKEATREGGHRRRHEPMRAQRGVHVPPRVRAAVAGGVGAAGQPPRGGWAPHAAVAGSVGCESGRVGSGGCEEAALGGGRTQGGSVRKSPDSWRQRTELSCGDEL